MSRQILVDDDAAQYENLQRRLKRLESSLGEMQRRNPNGNGSPEGVVDGPKGALYRRDNGSPSTLIYLKTTASGTLTGWTAIH